MRSFALPVVIVWVCLLTGCETLKYMVSPEYRCWQKQDPELIEICLKDLRAKQQLRLEEKRIRALRYQSIPDKTSYPSLRDGVDCTSYKLGDITKTKCR